MTPAKHRPIETRVPTVTVSDHGSFIVVNAGARYGFCWSCRNCGSYGYWQKDPAKAEQGGHRHKCRS